MNWTEIKATVPLSRIDDAAAIANMAVPYGIYIEDYSDLEEKAMEIAHVDLIDEELVLKDRTKAVIHCIFPRAITLTKQFLILRSGCPPQG